ncbi:KilA-N domain-containing protein [Xenorhabdus indica]|uniref:KilA-N domain-containing protein n=1 Tax=Xenorhabdus indica TaxID=333964 RepID=UPI001FE698F6|nr:KilA-N domain-containing protein [Xenorhabdus indica]MBC8947187.1 hypothetical protein [Xenorhabdus indica]
MKGKLLPVVVGVEIPLDEFRRYNLNTLHKASGTGSNKAPNQWLRTKQAQELINELESNSLKNIQTAYLQSDLKAVKEEEIAALVIDVMNGVPDQVPYNERPKKLEDILTTELNGIIFDATWERKATPAKVAKVILGNGYQKG